METGRLFEKTRSISRLLFLIPLTIILFVFAVFFSPWMTKGYVEGEGIVTKVEEDVTFDADDVSQTNYVTEFTYTVDGKNYKASYSFSDEKAVGSKITFYYNPDNPEQTSSTMNNAWLWLIFAGLGVAAAGYTVYSAITERNRNKQTDALRAERDEVAKQAAIYGTEEEELTEYYFRFDGHTLKPGYLIEGKDRVPLFEGKMLKNNPLAAREYEFINHRNNMSKVHKVSHTVTSSSGNSALSSRSYFKFDGVNIWDYLHNNGILIDSTIGDKLKMVYTITKNGRFLARAEMSSNNVHEEDAAAKKINIINKMFYRVYTNASDLEIIFTVIFAIAETDQAIYS